MSLLMDALRRAEAERKHQAARGQANDDGSPFTLEHDGDITRIADLAEGSTTAAGTPANRSDSHSRGNEISLGELSLEPLADAPDDELTASQSDALRDELADYTSTNTILGAARARAEQTATMPSARSLASDLGAYFNQTQSADAPRATAVDMTLEDVASHTLVGAQTVFTASERPRTSRVFVGAGIFVVLLSITIGLVVIFYARQGAPPRLSSPRVASGIEQPIVRELPVVPVEAVTARTDGINDGEGDSVLPRVDMQRPTAAVDSATTPLAQPNSVAVANSETVSETPTEAVAGTDLAQTATSALPPASAAAATVDRSPTAASPLPPAAADNVAARPQAVAAPPAIPPASMPAILPPARVATPVAATSNAAIADVGAGEVRIARRRPTATVDLTIAEGYAAFQRGDLGLAETRYNTALISEPLARDALIGLGAIALRQGNLAQAYQRYATVLERHPGDPVASAALLALTEAGGDGGAARLKLLLDDYPELAVLHFALGNWYAREQRWADAQQAYFDAARLDAGNADYAFNLAVSLDRLGQGGAALGYYQKSISLADNTGASFNPADALARIGALSATSTP